VTQAVVLDGDGHNGEEADEDSVAQDGHQ